MKTSLTGIEPIPVEFILGIAQSKATTAQRRPYVELIERWGDEQNCIDEARQLLKRLRKEQEIDPKEMPRDFMPRYRQPEVAEQLIEIVRKIDAIITSKQENWTWAHVMRVMTDELILYKPSFNRFDVIISSMIPNKGRDNIRKNGNYKYLLSHKDPWSQWPTEEISYINPTLAAERIICYQIAKLFAPILTRKIKEEL